jgi:hypothetical protein
LILISNSELKMATKSSWVGKARSFAAQKDIKLLESDISQIGRFYDDNENVKAVYDLLNKRSGFRLEGSDLRMLEKLLRQEL